MTEDPNGKNLKEKYKIGRTTTKLKDAAAVLSSDVSVAVFLRIVKRGKCAKEDFAEIGEDVESVLTALTVFGFIRIKKDVVTLMEVVLN